MIDKLLLFIDGSVNNQLKVGCGAYLTVDENETSETSHKDKIKVKTFENTSSTKLELQTLLWALGELLHTDKKVAVYTDSQNIIGLESRRLTLERRDFQTSNNETLTNHQLYRDFYKIIDQVDCEFVKTQGHQPKRSKEYFDHLFTLVDREARKVLRGLVDRLS